MYFYWHFSYIETAPKADDDTEGFEFNAEENDTFEQ